MPRKQTSDAVEHRITLGDFERAELRKLSKAELIKDYGQALQGAGSTLIGVGVVIASVVFLKFKAPDLIDDAKGAAQSAVNKVVDAGVNVLDSGVDGALKGAPISDRRTAQALAKEREDLKKAETYRCTHSSEGYDEQQCRLIGLEKDAFVIKRNNFNDYVSSTYAPPLFQEVTAQKLRNFIYRGLGDIDPLHPSRPNSNQRRKEDGIGIPVFNDKGEEVAGPGLPPNWGAKDN